MIGLPPILCYSFVALARLPITFAFQPLGHHSLSHKYWPCRKSRNNDAERFGRHLLLRTKPSGDDADDDEGERLFFDDFGDGFVGSAGAASSSSSFTSSLSERITSAKKDEEVTSAKLAKNWRTGNWGVRGFVLDSTDPIRESVADVTALSTEGAGPRLGGNGMSSSSADALEVPPIHVSTIVADQSHMHDEGYEVEVIDRIVVGRSDGSVLIVKIGTAYMTKFASVPKLRVDDSWDDNNNEASTEQDSAANGGPSVRVETELVNSDDVQRDLGDIADDYGEGDRSNGVQYPMEDPFDALYGSGNTGGSNVEQHAPTQESQLEGTPFEILFQFSAHDNEPISALLFVNDIVFSAGNTGDIRTWSMPGDNDDAKMMPGKTLSDAHSDRIVALKVLSSSPDAVEPDLLLSASRDGSFALWDINSGDLVTRCQMFADGSGSEPESITCADVDTSGVDGDVIFFGLGSGYVNGFYANDVIGSASVGGICPIPSSRFQANDGGVTAILAAGQGTSMSSSLQQARPTTILLTGGADGLVKQW